MHRTQFSLSHLLLATAIVATITGVAALNARWSRSVDAIEKRLTETERLLNEVAMPRYPNARVVVKKPDGRKAGWPLTRMPSGLLEKHDRRMMAHWNGPDEWGDASSGGYFWRYIGSEGDRDIYEFVVVFGKRLPAEPDERANSAVVRYVSFRNAPLDVVSENGFSISIAP
ncbi:membrane or secreted protein [Rhodopirellula maiorica SM1]|uniref:Membrane or secreted protein n=2 Tax=Novipirellula TaxID=2795426 RepID=M5R9A6_9BACT|nr:membrane or secreted protein [Rhodopirellula maiorica SM1]